MHPFRIRFPVSLGLAAMTLLVAAAQAAPSSGSRWQLDVGPSLLLNAKIDYVAGISSDPSLAPRSDRFYDNGFNRVDASNNLGDGAAGPLPSRTGFFGFAEDSQVDLRAGALSLQKLSAMPGHYLPSRSPDTRPGVDLNLRYSLARETASRNWGATAGLAWVRLENSRNGDVATNLRLLTDAYPLGGVVPQRAPYSGRFSPLPGDQRIGDVPVRTVAATPGIVSGRQAFRATTTIVRLGTWIEVFPSAPHHGPQRWSMLVQAGPALFASRARFQIEERLRSSASGVIVMETRSGARRRTDLGAFGGIKVRRTFSDTVAVVGWGDYLHGGRLSVTDGPRTARLDLSGVFAVGLALELRGNAR